MTTSEKSSAHAADDEKRRRSMIREAAVAGSFYAGTRDRLRAQVDDLRPASSTVREAIGVVVPHAGYMYSGRVAAAVYAQVAGPETWVIIGPNHTGLGAKASIMTSGMWKTPLGSMTIDTEIGQAILANSSTLREDHLAHTREHSIEVQLPFLQREHPSSRFVPIALSAHDYDGCRDVGLAAAAAIRAVGRRVVLAASTDMSHYVPRSVAAALDRKAIDAILVCDPVALHRVVRREGISMCGFHAATAVLVAAKALGATAAELVEYTDSGTVTGDTAEVVAYAGMIIR
jgi:MEMO1 family protein